jgi:hypothetical protein
MEGLGVILCTDDLDLSQSAHAISASEIANSNDWALWRHLCLYHYDLQIGSVFHVLNRAARQLQGYELGWPIDEEDSPSFFDIQFCGSAS